MCLLLRLSGAAQPAVMAAAAAGPPPPPVTAARRLITTDDRQLMCATYDAAGKVVELTNPSTMVVIALWSDSRARQSRREALRGGAPLLEVVSRLPRHSLAEVLRQSFGSWGVQSTKRLAGVVQRGGVGLAVTRAADIAAAASDGGQRARRELSCTVPLLLEALPSLVKEDTDGGMLLNVVNALCQCAGSQIYSRGCEETSCRRIAEYLSPLDDALRHPRPDVVATTAECIRRVSYCDEALAFVRRIPDIVPALASLLRSNDPQLFACTASSLSGMLVEWPEGKRDAIACGAPTALMRFIESGRGVRNVISGRLSVSGHAIQLMRTLVHGNHDLKLRFGEMGIIPILMDMATASHNKLNERFRALRGLRSLLVNCAELRPIAARHSCRLEEVVPPSGASKSGWSGRELRVSVFRPSVAGACILTRAQ